MGDLKQLDIFNVPLKGISLVEASAGTGKTYNIASLYVRALLELDLEPSQILVMTFTEAATAELKSRLRDRIRESLTVLNEEIKPKDAFFEALISADYEEPKIKLKKALDVFDEASVFTIHGFCNRLLTEYSVHFDVPSNVELLTDADELLQECVDDYWLEFNRKAQPESIEWFALSYLLEIGFGPDDLKALMEDILDETNSKIVPELDLQTLETEINQLKDSYFLAKEHWKKDQHKLKEILFSGHLHGGKFKNDKLDDYWEALKVWIERPEFTFKYPDELQKFSLYLFDSFNKSAPDYQVLDICRTIDKFLEIVEELSKIKVAFINESVDAIKSRFEASKRSRQVLSYNDMLTRVDQGLNQKSSKLLRQRLSEKFPFALVDEFQDTDHTQYSILKSIYHNRTSTGLFMIGDPKQAIYSFRGADVYTYLEAKSDITNDQAYGLMDNYRSNNKMIAGVNQLFSGSQHSFIDQGIHFQPARFPKERDDVSYLYDSEGKKVNPLQFLELSDNKYTSKKVLNEEVYSALSREIQELISGNYKVKMSDSDELETVKEKHIAILVWKGADGEKIQDVLRNVGIKSVLRSNTSVYSTEESIELFRVLNALQNLTNEPGIKAALVSSLIGYNAKDLKDLEENEDQWGSLIADLSMIRDEWNKYGIERALHLFFNQFDVFESFSGQPNAERKLSNLLHLSELLSKQSRESRFNPNALIRWYYSKINEKQDTAKARDEEQLRLESDDELVQITTMHSSKGLQYPIVFCPFLWSSKVLSGKEDVLKLKKDGSTIIDLSGSTQHTDKSEYLKLAREQNKAEDVRLVYVSLTRSVSACYVFLPNYNKIQHSPISYLLNGNAISDSIDFNSIRSDLASKGEIEIRKPVQNPSVFNSGSEQGIENYKALSLKRNDIQDHPRMLSYSSLVGSHGENSSGKDHDEILFDHNSSEEITPNIKNRFNFPRGANAGSFLHQIFEEHNFNDLSDLEKLIEDNLIRFGFDDLWQKPVKQWIINTIQHNLGNPDTSLSALSEQQVIKEMEFFFPVNNLQTSEIWRLIRLKHRYHNEIESYEGFIKGYIDLIFEWQGKFYILDYKSNHLGNQIQDYDEEALNNAVMDAGYDLQYHIYTLALHRYLGSRITDYSFEKHFGGVLYMFLRGIDLTRSGSGIYFHRPEYGLIQSLDEIIKGGGV